MKNFLANQLKSETNPSEIKVKKDRYDSVINKVLSKETTL